MNKNYYEILGVDESATQDEIKKAYRKLTLEFHPDKGGDENKFKEIAESYNIIGDTEKRKQYDQNKNNPFANMGGGISHEDFINQMFGNRGGNPFGNQQRRKSAPDKVVKVTINPIDSYRGTQKTIQYAKDNKCDSCNGSGGEQQVCTGCNGMGFHIKSVGTGFMTQQFRTACGGCGGRGYTLVHRCYSCSGNGVKPTTNQINIKLPVGVDSGQFLKFVDLGDFRNGEYGDLILQLEVIPQDGYEKMNNDLIYSLYLNLDEVLQDKFTIPHPDGDLNINAPNVFDTSKPLRLKGKGFPGGDMYVKLNLRFQKTT